MEKGLFFILKKEKTNKQHEMKFDQKKKKPTKKCAYLRPSGFTFGISPKEIIWSANEA